MNNQLPLDYRSSVLTYARSAENVLKAANIKTAEQAMAADIGILYDISAQLPRLHNLAIELNCFWGGELTLNQELPQAPIDRAAAFVALSKQINQFMDIQPEFDNIPVLLQKSDIQVYDDLAAGLNLVESLTAPSEKLKASAWLRSSFALLKTQLSCYRLKRREVSENKIFNSNLPELLAENLSHPGKQLNVVAVTEALCQTYYQFGESIRRPGVKKIEKHLLSHLKQQGCVDSNAETLPEVPEVLEQFSHLIADSCQFNLYLADAEKLIDKAINQLADGADSGLINQQIFSQLKTQGRRAVEPLRYNPDTKEIPALKPAGINPDLFVQQVENFNRYQGWIRAYEERPVAPELVVEYKKLLKDWINLTADKYDLAIGTIGDLLNFEDLPSHKRKYLENNLLKQAETVIEVCNAIQDCIGLNFNETGFNLSHLQKIKETPQLEYEQLMMLDGVFASFNKFYSQYPNQFVTGYENDISHDYIGRLIDLPPSAQRFKMLRYSCLAAEDIKTNLIEEEGRLEFRCAHNLQKVNRPILGQLISNIKDYCAPETDVEVLAQNIDLNINRFYLLPQYSEGQFSPQLAKKQLHNSLSDFGHSDMEERKIIESIAQEHYRWILPLHQDTINRTTYPSETFLNLFDNYQEVISQTDFFRKSSLLLKQALPEAKSFEDKYRELNQPHLATPQSGLNRFLISTMHHRSN